ncbi:hypothetical protein LOZ58_005333 [Ophidiomyces ophidiicola]|nr:hypothetical protein LOZ58_005333 [Ophidiomyces ophidiicola]
MEAFHDGETSMEVLVIEFGRAGTESLKDALLTLDCPHTYHTFDAIYASPQDSKAWLRALKAKCNGNKFGPENFQVILERYQGRIKKAAADNSAIKSVAEVIQNHPKAKVILTIGDLRDGDSWHRSFVNALQTAESSMVSVVLGCTARARGSHRDHSTFQKLDDTIYDGEWEKDGPEGFEQYYQRAQSLVPSENLLKYHVNEGWEPLCTFLDKPIPPGPVPNITQSTRFREKLRTRKLEISRSGLKKFLDIATHIVIAMSLVTAATTGLSLSQLAY